MFETDNSDAGISSTRRNWNAPEAHLIDLTLHVVLPLTDALYVIGSAGTVAHDTSDAQLSHCAGESRCKQCQRLRFHCDSLEVKLSKASSAQGIHVLGGEDMSLGADAVPSRKHMKLTEMGLCEQLSQLRRNCSAGLSKPSFIRLTTMRRLGPLETAAWENEDFHGIQRTQGSAEFRQ